MCGVGSKGVVRGRVCGGEGKEWCRGGCGCGEGK